MIRTAASTLLAIDTSTRSVGLALYNGVQILNETMWISQDYHTVELAPAIVDALQKNGLEARDLCAVAVATGPGSFTGLRIGLALAKGLTIVRHIPLIGIPTLDSLAVGQPPSDLPLAAVLRAGRGRLAVGWYRCDHGSWINVQEIDLLAPEELAKKIQSPTLVCGELTREERDLIAQDFPLIRLATPSQCVRRPAVLAELGWQRWQSGKVNDPASLAPTYLHYNDPIPG